MIPCARCNRQSSVDADTLTDPGGDPDLLPIVVAPAGWMPDPDDEDRIVCHGCATPDELEADDARAATACGRR